MREREPGLKETKQPNWMGGISLLEAAFKGKKNYGVQRRGSSKPTVRMRGKDLDGEWEKER